LKAPSFLIASEKPQYEEWFEPLPHDVYCHDSGAPHKLTRENWFPSDVVHKISEKGSIEMAVLASFIENFHCFMRKHVYSKNFTYP